MDKIYIFLNNNTGGGNIHKILNHVLAKNQQKDNINIIKDVNYKFNDFLIFSITDEIFNSFIDDDIEYYNLILKFDKYSCILLLIDCECNINNDINNNLNLSEKLNYLNNKYSNKFKICPFSEKKLLKYLDIITLNLKNF